MWMLLLRDLQHRWFDCLLSSLLIALVMGGILVQRSVSESAQNKIHELAHNLGKNMLVVPASMDLADFYRGKYGSSTMPADYAAKLQQSPLATHIRASTSMLYGNMSANGNSLVLVGMDPWHDEDGVAFLGREASRQLEVRAQGTFRLSGLSLSASEVIDSPPDGLDQGVFVSLGTAQSMLGHPAAINALRLGGCWCRIDVQTLAGNVEQVLPGTRAITAAGMVKAQKGSVAVMERYSVLLYVLGLFIVAGAIIVLVLSQVRRYRSEIGLLLAIGAQPLFVAALFVLKAALVGLLGGVLGRVVGDLLASHVASRLLELPVEISSHPFLILLVSIIGVSMLAASIPAWKAANLDPEEVLRND